MEHKQGACEIIPVAASADRQHEAVRINAGQSTPDFEIQELSLGFVKQSCRAIDAHQSLICLSVGWAPSLFHVSTHFDGIVEQTASTECLNEGVVRGYVCWDACVAHA